MPISMVLLVGSTRDARDLPGWARELLAEERVARLAFLDEDDRPRVLPVTFALAGEAVWSAIDEKPKRTPRAGPRTAPAPPPRGRAVRGRLLDDWSQLAWVQLLGRVEWLSVEQAPRGDGGARRQVRALRGATRPRAADAAGGRARLYWRATGSPRRDHSLQEPG